MAIQMGNSNFSDNSSEDVLTRHLLKLQKLKINFNNLQIDLKK